ncbi:EamA family transporter [Frankia sp. ACN1ag]|uniref:EamA family transporter n=1 Tax=Frankia sp. ACN1ag TaxID=102891 RepID=UPI0006DC9571|nr:DMT family transporter [Frankia sp. ACN1ag]KQC37747.1 hypothetical protein UK82_14145 [Frankia sp. ACN1ag]
MGKCSPALARLSWRPARGASPPRAGRSQSQVGFLAVTAATVLWAFDATAGKSFRAGVAPLELVEARTYVTAVGLGLFSYLWHARAGDRTSISENPPRFRHTLVFGLAAGTGRISLTGLAYGLLTAVAVASFSVLGESSSRAYGAASSMARAFAVSALAWVIIQAPQGWPRILTDTRHLPDVLLVGILGTLAPFVLFSWGVARAGSQAASAATALEPVFGVVLAGLWLGQSLNLRQLISAAVLIAAVLYLRTQMPPPDIPPAVQQLPARTARPATRLGGDEDPDSAQRTPKATTVAYPKQPVRRPDSQPTQGRFTTRCARSSASSRGRRDG